ncbi:PAS domain S-box protein [Sesbania bispinosa]|nr:PAS domain S-box protein [Sesbania bispinosa]
MARQPPETSSRRKEGDCLQHNDFSPLLQWLTRERRRGHAAKEQQGFSPFEQGQEGNHRRHLLRGRKEAAT